MITCAECGEENPDRNRFCGSCGRRLAEQASVEEERKVVSVLFADLVGFTARSDRADPEEVRATLRPYHARVKREIERFEGTVEKFVGDAVMAVFGAPLAHEDDAERAVRAGLRVIEAVEDLNRENPELRLTVRVAVTTGEAVVSLGARPEEGEGIVAGDIVNTAARLQEAAPEGAVVVGEATQRATSGVIDYEGLSPVRVKGKADSIALWRAVEARSRYEVESERPPTPFIGREDELSLLRQTYARTLRESAVQLFTVTGEPGVGKSRLIAEFFQWVDDRRELVSWRHGRCLPYGDGVTFWALGEIVKAHAGVLESDGPEQAAGKLARAVELVVEDPAQRDWLRVKLAPLVGASTAASVAADREESFTAWRTFLEAIAAEGPLVLVIEDLHWADSEMVGFVDYLVDWATAVPMLIVCSARPELYDRAPGWGGGKRNSTTLAMSPLSGEETARLISALLSEAALPAETQSALLERAGGNPLYAEEFVRMLTDRGILAREGKAWRIATDDIPVPDTVQALIAARLDTLAPERKALLQDASVVGRVFWSGALASVGGTDESAVREHLHALSREELVRSTRRSSMERQAQYSFWHVLIRDVAYGQIPRSARANKHRAVAEWIERVAGDRLADRADLLAHHYEEALKLAEASGSPDVGELADRARRAMVAAGDQALALSVDQATARFTQALQLSPPGHPQRGDILTRAAQASWFTGDLAEAQTLLEEAIGAFREREDPRAEARALTDLSVLISRKGDPVGGRSLIAEAVQLLEPFGPTADLAQAYASMAELLMLSVRSRACLEWAEKALALANELGLHRVAMRALQFRGSSRTELGDPGGVADLREALRIGLELGLGYETGTAYVNLGDDIWTTEGPAAGLEVHRAGIEFSRRRGLTNSEMWARGESAWMLFDLGEWDEVLRSSEDIIAWAGEREAIQHGVLARTYRARVLVERGEPGESASLVREFLPPARDIQDPQLLIPALGVAVLVHAALGEQRDATALVEELHEAVHDRPSWTRSWYLPEVFRTILPDGLALAERLLVGIKPEAVRWRNSLLTGRALVAEARGDSEEASALFGEAAQRWGEFGNVPDRAYALLGAGRCLLSLGRPGEATPSLRKSRKIFDRLRARPALVEADAALDRAARLSS